YRTRRAGDEGLVPQNGPPDRRIGQTSFPNPPPHAAPRLRFQVSERRCRYPRAPALPRPPQHHAYGAIYGASLRRLRWFLEGLTLPAPLLRLGEPAAPGYIGRIERVLLDNHAALRYVLGIVAVAVLLQQSAAARPCRPRLAGRIWRATPWPDACGVLRSEQYPVQDAPARPDPMRGAYRQ